MAVFIFYLLVSLSVTKCAPDYPRVEITLSTDNPHKEGDELTLTCSADSNLSVPQLSWTFGSSVLTHEKDLILTNLNRTNHGQYTCTATVKTNQYGNLTNSSHAEVIVNYAPDITFPPLNSSESNSSSITCTADGRPGNMNFQRFKQFWNGQFIQELTGTSVGNNKYRFTFTSASYQDSGTYLCSVDNGIPDRSGTTLQNKTNLVYIKAQPNITKETEFDLIVVAEVGKPVVLQKTVFTKPNYTNFTWSKSDNKTPLNETNIQQENITLQVHTKTITDSGYRISLTISSFKPEDAGTYTLTVCNEVGCSEFSVNLISARPPAAPINFTEEAESTSDTVILSWLPGFPGGNFKQRFLLEYKLQSEAEWKKDKWYDDSRKGQKVFANITHLVAKQVYDVRVSAQNDRLGDNVSEYKQIQVMTKARQEQGKATSLIGPAVRGAVGLVAVVVIVVVLVVLIRRRALLKKKKTESEIGRRSNGGSHCEDIENGQVDVLPEMDDNELYFMSGGSKKQAEPVMVVNELYSMSGGAKKGAEPDDKVPLYQASRAPRGNAYKNVELGKEDNTYANAAFDGKEDGVYQNNDGAKCGRDHDGLLYVGLDFTGYSPRKAVNKTDEAVEYVSIDWTKKADPLPDDE